MSLVVLQPGLFTTVQDRGRVGHRAFGVPVGGAFDAYSRDLANALVGNDPDQGDAVLEWTLQGGAYQAEASLALGLAGAPMQARVEGRSGSRSVRIPGSLTILPGERLIVLGTDRGVRTYMAVAGGWQTPLILGSRSQESPLRAGDRLEADPSCMPSRWTGRGLGEAFPRDIVLRIFEGPDLAASGLNLSEWASREYRVEPRSDRLGIRLEGPALAMTTESERLSAPVAPGAIQVAGHLPLILGVACGTMGGYPHVAQVVATDLPHLAQARPGGVVRFQYVPVEEARCAEREKTLSRRLRLKAMAWLARDGLRFYPDD